jgi:hypothetical protein
MNEQLPRSHEYRLCLEYHWYLLIRAQSDKTFVGAMSLILIDSRAKAHGFVQSMCLKKIVTCNNRHILKRTHHVSLTELVGAPPARDTA